MISSVVSLIVQEILADDDFERKTAWLDGFAILIAVFICSMVTTVNNY